MGRRLAGRTTSSKEFFSAKNLSRSVWWNHSAALSLLVAGAFAKSESTHFSLTLFARVPRRVSLEGQVHNICVSPFVRLVPRGFNLLWRVSP